MKTLYALLIFFAVVVAASAQMRYSRITGYFAPTIRYLDKDSANVAQRNESALFSNLWMGHHCGTHGKTLSDAVNWYTYGFQEWNGGASWGTNDMYQPGAPYKPLWVTNGMGAYQFDGVDDFFDMPGGPAKLATLSNGTVMCWTYFSNMAAQCFFNIGSSGDGFFTLYFSGVTSGKFGAFIRNAGSWLMYCESPATYTTNTWYHVAFTDDGTGNKLYVNGAQVFPSYSVGTNTTDAFFDNIASPTYFRWGCRTYTGGSSSSFVKGFLDELRVYNRVLTAAEIGLVYTNSLRGHP